MNPILSNTSSSSTPNPSYFSADEEKKNRTLDVVHSECSTEQPVAMLSSKLSGPIGSILDGFSSTIEKLLEKVANQAQNAGTALILKAGQEAILVIESLKGAYQDSLNKTYEKVDQLMRDSIDRVEGLMRVIISEEEEALIRVSERIEDIVDSLPLVNSDVPVLRDIQPRFFAVDGDPNDSTKPFSTKVMVVFRGKFAYAERYAPSFKVNDREYKPEFNSKRELRFLIDVSNTDPKLQMHRYSYLKGELRVDWKDGWWPWNWVLSKYNILLGMLPATVGKIKILYTKAESSISQRLSYTKQVERSRHDQGDKYLTGRVVFVPRSGWHIVRGSSAFNWLCSAGNVNHELQTDDKDLLIWKYFLGKPSAGTFLITYDESQTVPESERVEEIDDLRWGSSRIFFPKHDERIRKIVLEAFDGSHLEFPADRDANNSFIELKRISGGAFQIAVKRASDINATNIASFIKGLHAQKTVDWIREASSTITACPTEYSA